eukprot:scaffold142013_cov31-Tisochrysis_lutea.AAC.5
MFLPLPGRCCVYGSLLGLDVLEFEDGKHGYTVPWRLPCVECKLYPPTTSGTDDLVRSSSRVQDELVAAVVPIFVYRYTAYRRLGHRIFGGISVKGSNVIALRLPIASERHKLDSKTLLAWRCRSSVYCSKAVLRIPKVVHYDKILARGARNRREQERGHARVSVSLSTIGRRVVS